MRNLKKALALVLALMMTLSLMVTVSAAGYTDGDKISKDTAVDVMSALEVFNGVGGGNFNPTGTLTRAQAAKIIAYLQLGKENAEAFLDNTVASGTYSDVPANQWYTGAVEYCSSLGIVTGAGGKFRPKDTVTGYEFAKMLLCALGYDATIEGYSGSSLWKVNVGTQAKAIKMNVNVTYNDKALTREEACQMAYNILNATMVKYDKDGNRVAVTDKVEGTDVERTLGTSVFDMVKVTGQVFAIDDGVKLNKLASDGDYDDGNVALNMNADPALLGREVTAFYKTVGDKNEVYTIVDNSTNVLLTGNSTNDTKAVNDAAGATINWASMGTKEYSPSTGRITETNLGAIPSAAGTVVVVKGNAVIAVVTPTAYTLEKVENVDKDGFVKLVSESRLTKDTTGAVYEGIAKDDIVIKYVVASKTYLDKAATVVGKATAVGTGTITMGGQKYTVTDGKANAGDTGLNAIALGSVGFTAEYTLYLSPNGDVYAIVGQAEAPAATELVYAVANYEKKETGNYGDTTTNYVQCVNSNGEIVSFKVAGPVNGSSVIGHLCTVTAGDNGNYTFAADAEDGTAKGDKIQNNPYSNSNGAGKDKILLANKATVTTKEDSTETPITGHYYDSAVKFVYVTGSANDLKVTVKEGRQEVTIKGLTESTQTTAQTKVLYTLEAVEGSTNKLVKTVYVLEGYTAPTDYTADIVYANESDASTDKVPYVDAKGETKTGYKHTVAINGEKKEVITATATALTGYLKFAMDGEAYTFTALAGSNLKAAEKITSKFQNLISTADNHSGQVTDMDVSGATVVNLTSKEDAPTDATMLTPEYTVALVLNEKGDKAVTVYITAYTPYITVTKPANITLATTTGTQDVTLEVTTPESGTGVTVTPTSSDTDKATVAVKGGSGLTLTVTGKAAGTVTITCTLACTGYTNTVVTFTATVPSAS